jgi:hypothetical protein
MAFGRGSNELRSGPDDALAEEAERLREKNEEKYALIEDIKQLLMSMLNSDDLPDQDVHVYQIEDLYEQTKEIEF